MRPAPSTYSVLPYGVVNISNDGLATATGTVGGIVTITATVGSLTATATLTVQLNTAVVDPGMTSTVPPDASTHFTSTTNDDSRAPQLIYPNDGVLFPPNISGVEIHFQPGANNTLFEVTFTGPLATVKSYIRCVAPTRGITGCVYLPDPGLWTSVAASNAGQGTVTLVVRGTDDNGGSVGASQTFHMQFAKDPVMGALYYWNTSGKTMPCMLLDFGATTAAAPTAYLWTPTNTDGTTCVGCHALSPDGTKLVASAGGQGDGRLLLWNVSTNAALQPFPLQQHSQFESWNATGTQFVGVYGDGNPGSKGPSNLIALRRHGRHGELDDQSPGPGCAPITRTGRRTPTRHRPSCSRRSTRRPPPATSAPVDGRHRLRPADELGPGVAPDAGRLAAGEEPLLPGRHLARRRPGHLRRVDLHERHAEDEASRPTCRATPTPTPTATMYLDVDLRKHGADRADQRANSPGVADNGMTAPNQLLSKVCPVRPEPGRTAQASSGSRSRRPASTPPRARLRPTPSTPTRTPPAS